MVQSRWHSGGVHANTQSAQGHHSTERAHGSSRLKARRGASRRNDERAPRQVAHAVQDCVGEQL
jgi:hypothetical protein